MNTGELKIGGSEKRPFPVRAGTLRERLLANLLLAVGTLCVFYLSLTMTSRPVESGDMETIERAIALLETRGFDREAFLLRRAEFRSTDNWLNRLTRQERAYAATNRPFPVITVYPDFYGKAQDDTERAMILLHEAQHLQNEGEQGAYEYVWRNRRRLGWTTLSHGTTETFITTEIQTRENSPGIFTCPANLWSDCTENLRAGRRK